MRRHSVIRLQREINSVYLSYGPLHDLYHRLKQALQRRQPATH
jgi:hypothetical protein